jgi:hypothetical protein
MNGSCSARHVAGVFFLTLCFLNHIASAQASSPRVIHAFVALADNEHQGIVPVPAKIGNGSDPVHNLYWGAAAGVKTFFARSPNWALLNCKLNAKPDVLERCIFKRRDRQVYLVADAYRGAAIQRAILDFFAAAAGASPEVVAASDASHQPALSAGGGSNLAAYIGHDGLMDFRLPNPTGNRTDNRREAIILACASRQFFSEPLRASGAHPLLWTTGLMAPEAYTLESALDGWIENETGEQIRERAAVAYDKYQKCGLRGARRLFASGW